MKQYARIDTGLQASIRNNLTQFNAVLAQHSMLCMSTYELGAPFSMLITILREDVIIGKEDIPIFHNQFRHIFNTHMGLWFIIAQSPAQYATLVNALPNGHGVFITQSGTGKSNEELAEIISDFIFRLQIDKALNITGSTLTSFQIDLTVCPECSSQARVASGLRIFRNCNIMEEDTPRTEVFVPAADFSYPLYRYARTLTTAPFENGKYLCPVCNTPLQVSTPDIIPESHKNRLLTADDCLRYLSQQ